jgi:phage I-like protein
MKTLLFITMILFRRFTLVGNDAETTILANAADGGSPFAILQPDGFLVPFGEYPHKQGLQIFDRTAAEGIVAAHNSTLSKLVRHFGGGSYPVYVGHPDLPGSKDSDKRAYGWIENLTVAENGLHLSVKWSDAGRELVENAHFKFYSPLWWTKKVKGGIRPVALKSMGLTNDPNIPVPALANEADEENGDRGSEMEENHTQEIENEEPMKPEILAALGLEEGASPESVLAKITELATAANEAATRVTELEENAETLKAETLKVEEAKTAAETDLAAANEKATALESDLAGSVSAHVAQAAAIGRITPAEVPATVERIMAANDKAGELTALYQMPLKVKTSSATGDLGNAKSRLVIAANDESKARREERAQLVENEFQATNPNLSTGERKRIAWERARRKNPEAFGKEDSSGSAA